ncbi:MAG TPA: hypothetical protein VMC10_04945 [Stellaceae bacterium]|nr:hypothetical protein [Stellaceae bacterium]
MARTGRKKAAGEALLAPTPERWSRREVERLPRAIADEAGRPARPFHAPDTLLQMERRHTITVAMREAGETFRALFRLANLDPLRALDPAKVPETVRELHVSERQAEARRQVDGVMKAFGGRASPAGSCLWHVVGEERSLKDWALRAGWGGKPMKPDTASGILVGALGVLQAYYGL